MKFLLIYVPNLRFPYKGDWHKRKLNEICLFFKGNGLSKSDLSNEGFPCILYGELYTTYKNEVISDIVSKTTTTLSNPFLSKNNDLIIPGSGEDPIDIAVARAIYQNDIILGGDLNVLRPKSNVSAAFLSYQLNGVRRYDIAKKAQGKSIVHLHNSDLKEVCVSIPTYDEQLHIVKLLTKIDEMIETQSKIINSIKSQIRTINNHIAFDSTSSELSIASLFHVKTSNKLVESNTGKFCIVDMGTIDANGNYIIGKYTDDETSLIPYGTLVMPKDDIGGGKIICKTMCINASNKYALSDHVFALKLKNDNYNSVYFSALINSQYNNHKLKKLVTGSAQLGINQENLNRYKLKFSDSLELQHKYSELIIRLNEKLIVEKRLLDLFSSQKKYLLKNMFV